MSNFRIHYLQHVSFEGLGYIETWALSNGYKLSATKLFENSTFPNLDSFDMLIIMGGPMSVNDEQQFCWLKEEKLFIKQAIDNDKIVVGICLGAQLIANVLNAEVYANDTKEIGWFPVFTVDEVKPHVFDGLPNSFNVLHWHGETFDLPNNAVHLLYSEACKNQSFLFKNRVLALQFHLESTPNTIYGMIDNCGNELVANNYVQTKEQLLESGTQCSQSNLILKTVLDNLLRISS